jgi:hypothetical protein
MKGRWPQAWLLVRVISFSMALTAAGQAPCSQGASRTAADRHAAGHRHEPVALFILVSSHDGHVACIAEEMCRAQAYRLAGSLGQLHLGQHVERHRATAHNWREPAQAWVHLEGSSDTLSAEMLLCRCAALLSWEFDSLQILNKLSFQARFHMTCLSTGLFDCPQWWQYSERSVAT